MNNPILEPATGEADLILFIEGQGSARWNPWSFGRLGATEKQGNVFGCLLPNYYSHAGVGRLYDL